MLALRTYKTLFGLFFMVIAPDIHIGTVSEENAYVDDDSGSLSSIDTDSDSPDGSQDRQSRLLDQYQHQLQHKRSTAYTLQKLNAHTHQLPNDPNPKGQHSHVQMADQLMPSVDSDPDSNSDLDALAGDNLDDYEDEGITYIDSDGLFDADELGFDRSTNPYGIREPGDERAPWELPNVQGLQRPEPFEQERLLNILVYHGHYQDQVEKGKRGDTMGELVYWRAVLNALTNIHCNVTFISDDESALAKALDPAHDNFDILLFDGYSLGPIEKLGHVARPQSKCRFRMLDDWGTPESQNHPKLNLQQYLVPWTFQGGNFVLGHYLPAVNGEETQKKRQGVIWGKEPQYFQPHRALLNELSQIVQLVVMAKPQADQFLPPSVINLGIVSQAERRRVLQESVFLLGLGDPVLGLTPYEALRFGCAYINPLFSHPETKWMNSQFQYTSQHPEAEHIGKPYVYNVNLDRSETVLEAVKEALSYNEGQGIEPFIPADFTFAQFVHRLNTSLHSNYC